MIINNKCIVCGKESLRALCDECVRKAYEQNEENCK